MKYFLIITTVLFMFTGGCTISQQDYADIEAQLRASQAREFELNNQIDQLIEQYEIIGETPVQTAQNIVKQYHETHVYSKYDFFVCADMALDIWDMLKAHGINATINVGNVETGAKDITEADHAWVLAEVSPGSYLALEATGGYAVRAEVNSLYYEGWSFDNPRDYKRFVELRQEYAIRIESGKELWDTFETIRQTMLTVGVEYTELISQIEGVSMTDPSLENMLAELVLKSKEFGELVGRCDQLTDLINEQKQKVDNIISEMEGLVN